MRVVFLDMASVVERPPGEKVPHDGVSVVFRRVAPRSGVTAAPPDLLALVSLSYFSSCRDILFDYL